MMMHDGDRPAESITAAECDPNRHWEVEAIVAQRRDAEDARLFYLVKWKVCPRFAAQQELTKTVSKLLHALHALQFSFVGL